MISYIDTDSPKLLCWCQRLLRARLFCRPFQKYKSDLCPMPFSTDFWSGRFHIPELSVPRKGNHLVAWTYQYNSQEWILLCQFLKIRGCRLSTHKLKPLHCLRQMT